MSEVTYEIVQHDGGWAYKANGVFSEHSLGIGLPSNLVRSVAPLGDGQVLALCQSPSGSSLGHWDGTRWWSYTLPGVEVPLLGLTMIGGKAHVYTPTRLFKLQRDDDVEGTELVALAEGGEGAPRQFRPRPEAAGGPVLTMSFGALRRMVDKVRFAVSTEEMRLQLQGALLKAKLNDKNNG